MTWTYLRRGEEANVTRYFRVFEARTVGNFRGHVEQPVKFPRRTKQRRLDYLNLREPPLTNGNDDHAAVRCCSLTDN